MVDAKINIMRHSHLERQMRTVSVVIVNSLSGSEVDLVKIGETGVQIILRFERSNHAFGECIVITVANFAHTGTDTVLGQDIQVRARGVLYAMIAVVNEFSFLFGELFESHPQAINSTIGGQGAGYVPTDNKARVQIHQQEKISEASQLHFQISDITYPHLIGLRNRHSGQQVRSKPIARDRGAPIGFRAFHEHISLTQQAKKTVPADLYAFYGQHWPYFQQHFAGSQPRMFAPHLSHHFQDNLFLNLPLHVAFCLLIMCLASDAKLGTDLTHVHPSSWLLSDFSDKSLDDRTAFF